MIWKIANTTNIAAYWTRLMYRTPSCTRKSQTSQNYDQINYPFHAISTSQVPIHSTFDHSYTRYSTTSPRSIHLIPLSSWRQDTTPGEFLGGKRQVQAPAAWGTIRVGITCSSTFGLSSHKGVIRTNPHSCIWTISQPPSDLSQRQISS